MAVRSILEIDVDDSRFREFHALFEKYREALAKMPGAWGAVNQSTTKVRNDFANMASALMAQAEMLKLVSREGEKLQVTTAATSRHMATLVRDTTVLARNIRESTTWLLKWTGVVTAVGGLLGAGGLFGIDRLAMSAAGTRRGAMGLGISSADQQAFSLNFGRVVNPSQFLGGVMEAMSDVTKRYSLYGAGLTENQLRGRDTGQVAAMLMPQLKQIVDRAPQGQLAQVLQSRGLGQFLSLEEAQRLRSTPRAELQGYVAQYQRDRQSLFLTDEQLKRWQDFNVQLDRAGVTIRDSFIRGLDGLQKPLSNLSGAFAKAVESFLQSDTFRHWVDEATKGLEALDKWITSPEFEKDVNDFVTNIGKLSRKIIDALEMLGILPGKTKEPTMDTALTGGLVGGGLGAWLGARFGPLGAVVGTLIGGLFGTYKGAGGGTGGGAYRPGEGAGHFMGRQGHSDAVKGWFGEGTGWSTGPRQGSVVAPNDALFNWGSLRAGPGSAGAVQRASGSWQAFGSAQEGVQAVRNNLLRNYRDVPTLEGIFNRWAPGNENNTQLLIRRAAQMMGVGANEKLDLNDPETMRRLVSTIIAQEHGNVLPAGLSQRTIDSALGSRTGQGWLSFIGSAEAAPMPGFGGMRGLGEANFAQANPNVFGNPWSPGWAEKNLTTVTSPSGAKFRVNKYAAASFTGFLADLEGAGYKIDPSQSGGYNLRNIRGSNKPSSHAFGTAVDINWNQNPFQTNTTDFPPNIEEMAGKHGLMWGGKWSRPDPMHFEWTGRTASQDFVKRNVSRLPSASSEIPGLVSSAWAAHGARIEIHNQTGGSAVISGSQVAQ